MPPAGSDVQLVRAARAGDSESLGLLLHRHRARLYATALALLGHGEQAQDAVQETFVVALRRLHELREPASFAGWLTAIARSVCLMELRRRARVQLVTDPADELPSDDSFAAAENELERHALADWLWSAIDALPETQRLTVMLRHFGPERSYEEIAQLTAVPVGTVRSRLNAARASLAERMLATVATHESVGARAEQWQSRLAEALEALNRSDTSPAASLFSPDAVIRAGARTGGMVEVLPALLHESEHGIRVYADSVVTGADVVVLDGRIENPPDDPFHCPPVFTWVGFHDGRRIRRLRFHHPTRGRVAGT